ncbi:UDP-2,4-diacetamido-2,4,6-trideoxy-beta-L-altropyranose hydrolase [Vibrio sp. Vb339]|uniref:UDP-2,4-diacetamido-2,4, 6-trideoxy-beta-L-altropyranose hydrolase n=1 Tax=Vibrio sp. Vb339 TaxID=1192013 RepID=UPI001557E5DE|nr:UDP-2,4-diacetamido-2,4,6-trideoxy-beta-L-altropyranose hydrolase [Vibrio sp. Vb339]
MLVGIRVDASTKVGTGHTYRTLTLAQKLKKRGHEVFFISRQLEGNLIGMLEEEFKVLVLPPPSTEDFSNNHCTHGNWLEVVYESEITQTKHAINQYLSTKTQKKLDWLIIDNYAIEERFHQNVRDLCQYILQVDDLADRKHDVDLLLDQNYYALGEHRYDEYLSESARSLCGPKYALLREEFSLVRRSLPSYASRLKNKRVVLFFGGIDLSNETSKALTGLLSVESGDYFDVIIGMNNPHREEVEALCCLRQDRVSLHIQVNNMVDFFSAAYLYVGAVGATTWERCIVELPGIVCSVADNQTQLAKDLHEINGHTYLGLNANLCIEHYANAYQSYLSSPELLYEQSNRCGALVDGMGTSRVVEELERF